MKQENPSINQNDKSKNELMRLVHATRYSFDGLTAAALLEKPFRTELILFIFIIIAVFYFPVEYFDKALIIGAWLLVMATELINSSLELIADKINREFDPIIKRIKDYASAAVFLLLVNWLIITLVILKKHL